jgi:hypothetical protein
MRLRRAAFAFLLGSILLREAEAGNVITVNAGLDIDFATNNFRG